MRSPRALLLYQADNGSELLRSVVLHEGCEAEEAPLESLSATSPVDGYCLVVFDVDRPSQRILELLRAWHDEVPGTALVVIGSRMGQAKRLAVLETGVTAYLTKPVAVPELTARVRAAFRRFRSLGARSRQVSLGDGIIDLEARTLKAHERHVRLTPTECGILEHLALHMNQTVPRSDLVKMLWGPDSQKGVHSLRLFIRKLRQKLEPDPSNPIYLVTEPTIGYRLQKGDEG